MAECENGLSAPCVELCHVNFSPSLQLAGAGWLAVKHGAGVGISGKLI